MNRRKNITVLAWELYYFSHQVKRKTTRSILRNLPFCLCHLECNKIRFTSPASSHYWDESEIYYCPFRRFPSTREWQIHIVILNVIQQASAVQRTALTRWVGALPLLSTPIQSPTHYIRWTPFGWINTSTPPSVPLKRGRNTKSPDVKMRRREYRNHLSSPYHGYKAKVILFMCFVLFPLVEGKPQAVQRNRTDAISRWLGGVVFIYKHYPEEFHFRICRSRRRRWIYSFSLQIKKEAHMLLF